MATSIRTVRTYPLDGSLREFDIPFEYLARKFVTVTLIGTDRRVLVLTTDYKFSTKTKIQTTKAWGPSDGYEMIEIRRFTSATDRLVDFTDGSILRAFDLNIAQVQTLHVAEEARDLTADTIGVNNDGNLDARGRRIVNAADAVDPGDLITLRQMAAWNDSALQSAQKALQSENAAKVSENAAKTSETNSKASETNSKASETDSKASETLAQKWAANPLSVEVAGGLFSALHYSNQSRLSSVAAKASETNSGLAASAASVSAGNAQTEADRAEVEADRAQTANPDEQLKKAQNLADVADKATSRSNLEVYSKSQVDSTIAPISTKLAAVEAVTTSLIGGGKWLNWSDPLVTEYIDFNVQQANTSLMDSLLVRFGVNVVEIRGRVEKNFTSGLRHICKVIKAPAGFTKCKVVPTYGIEGSSYRIIYITSTTMDTIDPATATSNVASLVAVVAPNPSWWMGDILIKFGN